MYPNINKMSIGFMTFTNSRGIFNKIKFFIRALLSFTESENQINKLQNLTLIRAAGGVYDFQNFKEIYLCNGLSSDLQNSWIPRKTSREYIL
jgi:hypothetical protein